MYCADMASSLFGSLHVLRWHGTELIWEPSCGALAWHGAHLGNLHVLRWHGTELIGDLSCCIGVALSYSLEIFI